MKFTKIHGLGNDYIYIDAREMKLKNMNNLAKSLSDRHLGIGSDGLILLLNSKVADYKMRIFNSDGSEAEMCGNGIRGLAKFIYENNISKKKVLTIETLGGIKKLKLNIKNKKVLNVTVDMGNVNYVKSDYLNVDDKVYNFEFIDIGNPHLVIFTDNLRKVNIQRLGPLLENHPLFPNKTNVEFVQIIDRNNIYMKVWERGSGETLACGTGATASVIAGNLNNKLNKCCNVHLKYGILRIYFDKKANKAYLTGKITKVFDGEIKRTNLR